jgi:opacity protein-like surface antigen
MFDGILSNMATDIVRKGLVAIAMYFVGVGVLPSANEDKFVAAGLTIFAVLWDWYENVGHQKIVNSLKAATGTDNIKSAMAAVRTMFFVIGATAMLCLTLGQAHAQGIVTKTPPTPFSSPCTASNCTGVYIGGTLGAGMIGADAGAQLWNNSAFLGAEIGVGGQVYSDPALTANMNGLFTYEIGKAGGSLAGLFGTPSGSPQASLPILAANVISPYALAGGFQRDVTKIGLASGWTVGGGLEYDVTPRLFIDAKVLYVTYSATKLPSETVTLAGADYKF